MVFQDLALLLLPHLQGALSADAELRWNSFLLLDKAEKDSLGQYLLALTSILVNPQLDEVVRITAGVRIKNGTSGSSASTSSEKRAAYLQLTESTRREIKTIILDYLVGCPKFLNKTLSQVIASIGTCELQGGSWDELIPRLCETTNCDTTFIALQFLLEDVFLCQCTLPEETGQEETALLSAEDVDRIMGVILEACADNTSVERVQHGLQTLYYAITFLEEYMCSPVQQARVLNTIKATLQCNEVKLNTLAWQVIHEACMYLYDVVNWNDLLEVMAPLTMGILKLEVARSPDKEELCLAVLSFWSSLADTELEMKQEGRSSHNIMALAREHLVPCLLTLLRKEDEDEDEWNSAMAASVCLGYCGGLFGDEISPYVLNYVEANYQSTDWASRESALLAFGTIIEGCSEQHMVPILKDTLSNFILMIMDPPYGNIAVQDTASWTLGQVAKFHPATLIPFIDDLIPALIQLLGHAPRVARYICFIIYELAAYAREERLPFLKNYDEMLLTSLLQAAKREDNNALAVLSAEAFETISMLVMQFNAMEAPLVDCLLSDLSEILKKTMEFQESEDPARIRQYVIGCIQTCLSYYTVDTPGETPKVPGERINFQCILDLLCHQTGTVIAQRQNNSGDEFPETLKESQLEEMTILMMAIETVLVLGSQRKTGISMNPQQTTTLMSLIEIGLQRTNTETQWDAAMSLLTAIMQMSNCIDIQPSFIDRMVQQLCIWMRESSTNLMFKLIIISALGDMSMYLNYPIVTQDTHSILGTLMFVTNTTVEDLNKVFLEQSQTIQYVRSLREALLVSLGQVVNSVHRTKDESQRNFLQFNTNRIILFITNALEDNLTVNERIIRESLELLGDLMQEFGEALAEHLRTFESAGKIKNLFNAARQLIPPERLSQRTSYVLSLYDNVAA